MSDHPLSVGEEPLSAKKLGHREKNHVCRKPRGPGREETTPSILIRSFSLSPLPRVEPRVKKAEDLARKGVEIQFGADDAQLLISPLSRGAICATPADFPRGLNQNV